MKKTIKPLYLLLITPLFLGACNGGATNESIYSYPNINDSSNNVIVDYDFDKEGVFDFLSNQENIDNYQLYLDAINEGGDGHFNNISSITSVEKLNYVDENDSPLAGNFDKTIQINKTRDEQEYSISGTINTVTSELVENSDTASLETINTTTTASYSLSIDSNMISFTELIDYEDETIEDELNRSTFTLETYYEYLDLTNAKEYLDNFNNEYLNSGLTSGINYSASLSENITTFTMTFTYNISNDTDIVENNFTLSYQILDGVIIEITYLKTINDITDGKSFNTYSYTETNKLSRQIQTEE